ncbi:MAG: PEGA domain-containing protein [Candidatus Levybacteria bacterium]|nr:PEGA domain-containing protein [Candidatus Levybacteria bacterium]
MFRKIILFFTPLLILTILFLLIVLIINRDEGKGALQVTSVPGAQVFIEGKYAGKTPLCLCELPQLLKAGDYNIKLIPSKTGFKNYEQKITIYQGVLTVVDRTFEVEDGASTGSIITLSPIENEKSELLVVSFPNKAQVILDSNLAGTTPLLLKEITPSDHEIQVLKDGYKEKTIKVKAIERKRLEVIMNLGIKLDINAQEKRASSSAVSVQQVTILDTPTGYLRVRKEGSASSEQIANVNPGDKLDLISEKDGWYEIRLPDGTLGWISSAYAKKD